MDADERSRLMGLCAHHWIDPAAPPIARVLVSPVVGPGAREMRPGGRYVCQRCGQWLEVPTRAQVFGGPTTTKQEARPHD
jgi:hypothetical protein